MDRQIKRILVLAPHTDDGEFGCGGTVARFVREDKEIFYIAFSTAEESVPPGFPKNILETEVRNATRILGIQPGNLIVYKFQVRKLNYVRQEILDELVKIKDDIRPDLVFIPSVHDLHQDHYTIAMEGMRAFKKTGIFAYEIPWNNMTFHTQAFIKLHKGHVQKKVDALKAYESQSKRSYATEEFIWSLAKTRGVQISADYAETFEVIRWVL